MVYNDLTLISNLPLAFGIVIGSLFVLIGLVMAVVGIVTLRKWLASRHWPQAPARIVVSEVREVHHFEDQVMFQPEVKFTFAVGRNEITGTNIAFANKLYQTHAQATRAASQYPVGRVVMARYDPQEPTQAVLLPRGGLAGLLLTGLGGAMMIGTLFVVQQAGLPAGWLAAILSGVAGTASLLGWWIGRRFLCARRAGIYPPPGRGTDADVERLVRRGEKMLAIRLYRELHGTDLKVSRLRVEEISSRLAGK